MEYVVWSEMFSIQVPYIDSQHKKLLDIANEFHAALKENKSSDILFPILNSLIRYAEEHFRDEESVMELAGYPPNDALSHKEIHDQLVREIFTMAEELKNNGEKTLHDVEVFLNGWLIKHILLEDKKIAPYAVFLKRQSPYKQ